MEAEMLEVQSLPPYVEPFLQLSQEYFSEASHQLVKAALRVAVEKLDGMTRYDGTPLVLHSVGTATIVMCEIGLGRNSVISTLLHDVVRLELMDLNRIGRHYGEQCIGILKGLCNISDVDTKAAEDQVDNFRELIVSYSSDPRVILIKLADRLEVMRSLDMFPEEKRQKKSWESLNLYAQIAHKLGLYSIKSELEDISLKYLESEDYNYIRRRLEDTAAEREVFIKGFVRPIEEKMRQQKFKYHLKSRTKSIYSIWRKMKRMHIGFDEVYDLFAIRIVIDCPREQEKAFCWAVYSIVTDFYTPNPDRMRDWISIPKSNGYESLHTTVVTPEGRWVEIQIRTERMDEVAERGVAAHWRYKGVKGDGMGTEEWFSRIRELIEATENQPRADKFNVKLSSGEIFVFTPNGDLRKLNEGATVLDFAFDIHSNLGASCTGGKVNHRNVSFKEQLKNGDIVEILTSKSQKPKADWLNIVTTSKARNKIKAYLREEQAKAASLGRDVLERLAQGNHLSLDAIPDTVWQKVQNELSVESREALYASIGLGKDLPATVIHRLVRLMHDTEKEAFATTALPEIVIRGNEGVAVELSKCCHPIPGDKIVGFSRAGHGLVIHRADCPHVERGRKAEPSRWVDVQWAPDQRNANFAVPLEIRVEDPHASIAQVATSVAEANSSIVGMMIDDEDAQKFIRITIQVRDRGHLMHVMRTIRQNANVEQVKRVFEAGIPSDRRRQARR